jgi:hypothetical protein
MMDARTEQASLREDPLPPVVIINPLTRVWDIDGQIAALQEQINDLQQARAEALEYAIREQIVEDENCRLDRKVRRIRSLDADRFREVFPEEYMIACDIERKEKEEALNHIGEKINLTLVDKLIKKPALAAAQGVISVKESVSYAVVRR